TVLFQGVTIANGRASSGVRAGGSGGGIRDQGNASLTLRDVTVTNNTATADGGGIAVVNSTGSRWTLTINHGTISNNDAGGSGGGIATDGAGVITVRAGTVIAGNTAQNHGAGIWLGAIADAV